MSKQQPNLPFLECLSGQIASAGSLEQRDVPSGLDISLLLQPGQSPSSEKYLQGKAESFWALFQIEEKRNQSEGYWKRLSAPIHMEHTRPADLYIYIYISGIWCELNGSDQSRNLDMDFQWWLRNNPIFWKVWLKGKKSCKTLKITHYK